MVTIFNPICADCGHELLSHFPDSRPTGGPGGCAGVESQGDCQCAGFAKGGSLVVETLTNKHVVVTANQEHVATVKQEATADPYYREAIEKLRSGVWSVNRARQELGVLPYEKTEDVFPESFLTEAGKRIVEEPTPVPMNLEPDIDASVMNTEEFTSLIEEQIKRSTSLLIDKAKEYASDTDRLHNFKVAAGILGETQEQALGGFLAKHIVSVFDMINSGKEYPIEVWNEKITDSINYLLILRAMQR
jgi:hypothetical protein